MVSSAVLTFDLSVEIRRPPATVFALLADIQDFEPIPRDAVVTLVKEPSGPTEVGTRWHERVRLAPHIWLHVENLVSEADAPHRLTIDARSSWMTAHLTYEIEPVADGSVLRQHETLRLRALPRWLGPYIERRLRPRLHRRLSDIKAILEAPPSSGTPSTA
ncbi:SRPBCC family protein [Amycolatopsis sp. NPDC049868]|uniref:SRPBCC family protein n=1 Tax=Amycolatopsis sp. NPDC049868 TaxID=3363934 RepID=UPI0037BC3704